MERALCLLFLLTALNGYVAAWRQHKEALGSFSRATLVLAALAALTILIAILFYCQVGDLFSVEMKTDVNNFSAVSSSQLSWMKDLRKKKDICRAQVTSRSKSPQQMRVSEVRAAAAAATRWSTRNTAAFPIRQMIRPILQSPNVLSAPAPNVRSVPAPAPPVEHVYDDRPVIPVSALSSGLTLSIKPTIQSTGVVQAVQAVQVTLVPLRAVIIIPQPSERILNNITQAGHINDDPKTVILSIQPVGGLGQAAQLTLTVVSQIAELVLSAQPTDRGKDNRMSISGRNPIVGRNHESLLQTAVAALSAL
ncbi:hypothetical protein R1sor_024390 [Riccia sorocarpa]|uniref:Uncharacterized protein n=1 Tax=Riccia sorocarpa TaxID=122646 RepID=A0ABD3GST6_9MARC